MSVITPGTTFANGEQLTASDLNLLVQGASFSQNAVDNNSTILVGSAITVADGGITSAKLDADAVTTSKILDGEVTKAKIENVSAPLKVLGRMSAGAGAVEEVAVISDDELVGASATTLATSTSIKAYVDAQDLTGYALKYSGSTGTKSVTSSFADWDISSVVGVNRAMVIIEMWDASAGNSLMLRTKGSSVEPYTATALAGWGASGVIASTANQGGTLVVITDASGVIQLKGKVSATGINYKIQAYQKLA